jgi:hypothetical protein
LRPPQTGIRLDRLTGVQALVPFELVLGRRRVVAAIRTPSVAVHDYDASDLGTVGRNATVGRRASISGSPR